jgi:ABC-type protease/lipase transport system fused ATPase/permease subunit
VVKVAKIAGIHEFILKFPGGYDSILTGGYQNLSGGERQRLGLARAIYHDPACLLLDEPNSALDPSGELALKNVIDHCRNSGTLTLVVTHRRSVLAYSDKILDLSNPKSIIFTHREEYLKRFNSKEDFDRRFTL